MSAAPTPSDAVLRALEEDAARYRWLRENWWNYSGVFSGVSDNGYPMQPKIGGTEFWSLRDALLDVGSHDELDAAIDAARSAVAQAKEKT